MGRIGLAQGVPVWADWYSIDGSHGTNSRPPTTRAPAAFHAARLAAASRPRNACHSTISPAAASSHSAQ